MSTVTLSIAGQYWDSFIYRGRLYLFGLDGSVRTILWDKLIEQVVNVPEDRLAVECAFLRGDYLYGDKWSLLFKDPDIKDLIRKKFDQMAAQKLMLDSTSLNKCEISHQDTPFAFPHSDCTIYRRHFYATSSAGVFRASCRGTTKDAISSKASRLSDVPVVSIAISYDTAALGAGSEGLFELPLAEWKDPTSIKCLSPKHCTFVSWLYYSVFGSSALSGGQLADYNNVTEDQDDRTGPVQRALNRIISSDEIFGTDGYSWGLHDKLYQYRGKSLHAIRYEPWNDAKGDVDLDSDGTDITDFIDLGIVRLGRSWTKVELISAGTALFGTIVETDDGLYVFKSDGSHEFFPGEPTNWRCFPRSVFYSNQLHVIWGDRMDVISFNDDYFIEQKKKKLGIRYSPLLLKTD